MFDTTRSQDKRIQRSLLDYGSARAERTAAPRGSLLAVEPEVDPAERHRQARSRREARTNPLLSALATAPQREPFEDDVGREAPQAAQTGADHPAAAAQNENSPAASTENRIQAWLAGLVPSWRERVEMHAMPPEPVADSPDVQAPVAPVAREPTRVAVEDIVEPRPQTPDLYWKPLIDPMAVIGGVARSKLLIVSCTILGAALGVFIALSTPKKYEASTELLVDPRDLKLTERDLTESGLPSDATLAIVENQVRIMTSGTVLNKVVDTLNLEHDPEFNGEGGATSIGIREVIGMIRSLLSRQDGAEGQADNRRRAFAVGNLGQSLSVIRGGKTFVIVVSATTLDPDKSALIANTMTKVYLETYGDIQSEAAGRAESEINSRLAELRTAVEAAERKVQAFKAENDLVDAGGRLITDDEIVGLNGQLSVARARTLELNAKAASARGVDVNQVIGGALPEQLGSPSLIELRGQYASVKQESDRQAVRLGPRHPQRLALDAQLAGLRDQINQELRRSVESIQVELKRAVQLEQELAARLAQLKVRQGDVSSEMVSLREMEREAAAKRSVYEAFLLRASETGEQKGINTANLSVLSVAYPPLDPLGPSRATISMTGMVLGLMAGMGLGVVRGAYAGLRANVGLPQRRRRWQRWLSPEELARRVRSAGAPGPLPLVPESAPAAVEPQSAVAAEATAAPAESPPPTDPAVKPMEAAMHDPYAQPFAPAPQPVQPPMAYPPYPPVYAAPYPPQPQMAQPMAQAPMPPAYHQPMPGYAQPYPPQAYAPPPAMPYGYPPAPQPAWHGWQQPQQMAPAPYPYVQPAPAPYAPAAAPQAAQPAAAPQQQAENQSQIDEIRASLREFRAAVKDLAESRQRRRFF